MQLNSEKTVEFLRKRIFLVIIICLFLVIILFEFIYWKYLYLPSHSPRIETVIENRIEEENFNNLIKRIEAREEYNLQRLNKDYKDPFQ